MKHDLIRQLINPTFFYFQTNSTHAIYSNSLFLYPPSNGSLVLPEVIPFSCAYPLETSASLTSIRSVV